MTVEPGKGGQTLISDMVNKLQTLKNYIDENDFETQIEVDGGINLATCEKVKKAGASMLVAGTAILMAKNGVDGVYTDDPNVNKDAKKLENIDYDEIIKHDLKVMDRSACDLCQQNNIPIIVFDFKAKDAIKRIILGEKVGTYVGKQ